MYKRQVLDVAGTLDVGGNSSVTQEALSLILVADTVSAHGVDGHSSNLGSGLGGIALGLSGTGLNSTHGGDVVGLEVVVVAVVSSCLLYTSFMAMIAARKTTMPRVMNMRE